jgi:hypothetical protein
VLQRAIDLKHDNVNPTNTLHLAPPRRPTHLQGAAT